MCQEERDRTRSPGLQRAKSPSRIDGTPVELPGFMKSNYYLHHEDLSMGQKKYIWGVARIYSVTQLMSLKQRQYQSLLDYEFSRRIQNKELKEHERVKEWKDYQRYSRFIKRYEQVIMFYDKFVRIFAAINHLNRPRLSLSDLVAQPAE